MLCAQFAAFVAAEEQCESSRPPQPREWRYSPQRGCIGVAPSDLEITPSAIELASGVWAGGRLDTIAETFRRCGVVALPNAAPRAAAEAFGGALEGYIRPLLASRRRVRATLARAMARGGKLRELYSSASLGDELVLRDASMNERHVGRFDVRLEWKSPYNAAELGLQPLLLALLRRLLGKNAELKSVHGIVALPGASAQSWHRDSPLLWDEGDASAPSPVHAARGGVHLPPFAINVFAPLRDVARADGPTEFVLGSHMWAPVWAEDEAAEEGGTERAFALRAGSFVVADYRTVHRGGANRSPRRRARALAMFVWGRRWWHDATNYRSALHYAQVGIVSAAARRTGATRALRQIQSTAEAVQPRAAAAAAPPRQPRRGSAGEQPETGVDAAAAPTPKYWSLVNIWEDDLRALLGADGELREVVGALS